MPPPPWDPKKEWERYILYTLEEVQTPHAPLFEDVSANTMKRKYRGSPQILLKWNTGW